MNISLIIDGFGRALLVSVFALACTATLKAQNTGSGSSITLRPVDTGRSIVTFSLGNSGTFLDGRFAIKTNILYAIGLQTPNLALEYSIGERSSVEATIGYNGWGNLWDNSETGPAYDPNNNYKKRLDHFLVKAEYCYWFRGIFDGQFVAGGLFYSKYRTGELKFMRLFDEGFDYYGNLFGIRSGHQYPPRKRHRGYRGLSAGQLLVGHERQRDDVLLHGRIQRQPNLSELSA